LKKKKKKCMFYLGLLVLFRNFGAKCIPYGAKYGEMAFYKHVLKFYSSPIPT